MTILTKYNNGNTTVTIMGDGTKVREYNNEPLPVFPESIDCKITNMCSGNLGKPCLWCHENSTPNGKHADLNKLIDVITDLPAGVEIACGGGDTFSHPNLYSFLIALKGKGLIVNATINSMHIKKHKDNVIKYLNEGLIHGLGITYSNKFRGNIDYIIDKSNNIVFHLVMGINILEDLEYLYTYSKDRNCICKVLILGYKQFRSGISFYDKTPGIEENKNKWYREIRKFFGKPGLVISFDNLAIEQLNLKRFFTDKSWDKFYMGDDGDFTMYIDAVNECYARSSTSHNRKSFDEYSILSFFGGLR